ITVKVPFPFMVGSESFAAGNYDIQPADLGSSVIAIRGMDKHPLSGFALTSLAGGTDPEGDQPVLVFKKWENTYRLAEIWQSRDVGAELPRFTDPGTSASNGAPAASDEFTGESTYIVTAHHK